MKTLSQLLQYIFAPIRCVVCGLSGAYICRNHEKYLLGYPTCCRHCTTPTTYTQNCNEHQSSNTTGLSGLIVGFYYTNLVKYIIHKAKYGGSFHLFSYFAKKLSLLIETHLLPLHKSIIITYVPMHYKKELYQRGYNQAQKLAEYLASELNTPCIQLLTKTISTKAQMKKDRKDRQKQSENIYEIISTHISSDAIILLVDDVITTGSTLSSAAKVIKTHYSQNSIRGVCIARNT